MNESSILIMYAASPCHAGSGSSLGAVDLPIQRERHTVWPVIQSSGMKGAMRAHFERHRDRIPGKDAIAQFNDLTNLVFGKDGSEYAGSLSVSDAKILAFPMRSSISPFVWITSPSVLKRLERDLRLAEKITQIPSFSGIDAIVTNTAALVLKNVPAGKVLLEDAEVTATVDQALVDSVNALLPYFAGAERLLLVSDEIFRYGVESCTQIAAQIKIEASTGTTTDKSLRYQEELPADTIMYCILQWGDSREGGSLHKYSAIKGWVRGSVMNSHLQVGGDETLGRGIFELTWI